MNRRARVMFLVVQGVIALGLVACARTQVGFTSEESRITARWIEDVAAGLERQPGELRLRPATKEMTALAAILIHGTGPGRWTAVDPVEARRQRRKELDGLLAKGEILMDGEAGLVGPAPGLAEDQVLIVSAIADAENRDRRLIDALVLSCTQASGQAAETYLATAREERRIRDLTAGGRPGRRQR